MKRKEYIRWFSLYDRSRQKFIVDKGKVQRFVVQYESYIETKWYPIIRYDTAHGFLHRDVLYPDGTKKKTNFSHIEYAEAFTFAEIDIQNNWQRYKKQYLEKMKKWLTLEN